MVLAVVGLDQVVVAVIFAFHGGRAAALAAWGLVVVADLVATEVWNGCRHGVPPWVSVSCMIFQTNHLAADRFCIILKTKEMICKIFKTLELWFLWSFRVDTSLRLVDSVAH